ncbi:MAG: alkaline phosphatase family protein [Polyangiaceae bacterium]
MFARCLPAWNTRDTFVAEVPHGRVHAEAPPPVARRLVWVVVDGLTYDVAADTETILPIADAGVMRPMAAAFPTFTAGGIASMFTGQSPRESGVRLNGATVGAPDLDDVLHAAEDAGIAVRVHARDYPPFVELVRAPARAHVSHGHLPILVDAAGWAVEPEHPREVDAIHFGEVDDRGHDAGSASPGYREAALHAGVFLQRLTASLDPSSDVLIAVSDHGHRADGGHGGIEEGVRRACFLAWGASIRRGVVLPERPLRDVAATATMLLGAHTPSSNMGAPMLDILDVPAAERAARLAEPFEQLVRYDCTQAPDLAACADAAAARDGLARGDDAEAERVLQALTGSLDARRDADQRAGSTTRAIVGVLIGVALLALGSLARPSRKALVALPFVAIGPYVSLLLAMGYLPTLSKMTATTVFAGDAAWAAALPLPLVAFVAARHALGVAEVIWLEAVGLAIVVPLLVWAGANPRETFDPLAGVLIFQLSPIALLTAVSGAVIVLTRAIRLARRARSARLRAPAPRSSRR